MNANVGRFVHHWALQDPERTAIVDSGRSEIRYSYGELDREARRVAGHLRSRGLGLHDRVAISTGNGLNFVASWFGAAYAGCTTLPIPVMSTAHEIAFRLQHAGCKALLADAERFAVAHESQLRAGGSCALLSIEEALASEVCEDAPCDTPADAFAMLLYTSGTTGAAKGVCITHGSLGAHTRALAEHTLELTSEDRILGTLPLTHSYGIRTTLLAPFFAGASTIFVPRFSAALTLELCTRHRVTWLPAVPTMLVAWANESKMPVPPALRWCLSAGAPLPEDVRRRAEDRLGAPVRQGYGLTEANLAAINAPPDRLVEGSSGKPVPGVALRIASDSGEDVRQGELGEVLIRGQNVMAGYLDDKIASAHVMRGGWLHTGDIGFVDADGRLTIVDRSKDLILRGGASIYPSELENALVHHSAIHDVAVVGIPNDYYGEEVIAVVVRSTRVSVEELDAWVRERLAPYKVPRGYAFIESIPEGPSGKTMKRRLRDRLVAGEIQIERLPTHGSAH
jgi:long-chain acyl-CoA synthetase